MVNLLNAFINMINFESDAINRNELERYAKAEYKKDWQHAYAMLVQGKKPDFRGLVK